MPKLSTPRSLPTVMAKGAAPSSAGGSSAPTSASGTRMPTRAFGAPQTICSGPSGECAPASDLAHAQAVGIGVLHRLDDLGDDHACERRRDGAGVFDLQPGHGQQLGQFGGGDGRVAELAQPGFGELHASVSGST